MSGRIVRIGGASGFWGDSPAAVTQLLEVAELDYLSFDYLAELTMSILARARARDPATGYATDFVEAAMRRVLRKVVDRGIRVVSNAGGMNPRGCAEALHKLAESEGLNLSIGIVEGDDLLPRMDALRARDVRDLHSGAPLPAKLLSANAYLGALPIVNALQRGAQVVITGRCVDSALPLAALIHEFGWSMQDYDRLAAGSLAGHLIECGPQATGGLFTDWEDVPGWDNIGYPVVECEPDGCFVITKPAGTGGLVTPAVVAEQMLYEIGDPAAYVLPDVVCDFTGVELRQLGADRVGVSNVRGRAPTTEYKVSATYADGWRCVTNITLVGGRAERKAARIAETILKRTRRLLQEKGLNDYRRTYAEVLGTESLFGPHSHIAASREVVLRLVVDHERPEALELFAAEIAPGSTSWAPGMTHIGGGRPKPAPIVRLFSFLWPKSEMEAVVTVGEEGRALTPITVEQLAAHAAPVPLPLPESAAEIPDGIDVPLLQIAHGRSGDKGNSVNIGIIARDPKWLPVLRSQLTAQRVHAYFAHLVAGPVTRYDVPGVNAFNFLLQNALDGGGMASPRSDPLGKAFAQMLLDLPIRIPAADGSED